MTSFNVGIALLAAVGGCCWNGLELEYVVSHHSGLGKTFGYGLTVLQCFGVAAAAAIQYILVKMYYFYCASLQTGNKKMSPSSSSSPLPRPTSLGRLSNNKNNNSSKSEKPLHLAVVLPHEFKRVLPFSLVCLSAFLFWASNLTNNISFGYGIAVPIMQVVRSSTLLTTAATSYALQGTKFTLVQISVMVFITLGISGLSILRPMTTSSTEDQNKNNNSFSMDCTSSNNNNTVAGDCELQKMMLLASISAQDKKVLPLFPDPNDASAVFNWFVGVFVLILASFLNSLLGVSQGNLFRAASARVKNLNSLPCVAAEAIFSTHVGSLVLFAALGSDGIVKPVEQFLYDFPPDLQKHVILNVVSQFACISGVFSLSKIFTPIVVTMATTVRKFLALLVSLVVFGHAMDMSMAQFSCIMLTTVAVGVYPFLPSPVTVVAKEKVMMPIDEPKMKKKQA